MFANLIESDSHRQELKRRSSFFLATVAAYALILFVAGIVSIYAYDARLETQTSSLELLNWVPPVLRDAPQHVHEDQPRSIRRPSSNAPVDPHARIQERTIAIAPINPNNVPTEVGIRAPEVPPVTDLYRLGSRNVNPPTPPSPSDNCLTCNSTQARTVENDLPAPAPTPVKPQTQRLPPQILVSKAISLPQPAYPPLAKQIHVQGSVPVQILVGENGRVISAHAVSGHAFLTRAAEEAAMRARFTPTTYNGQPVKVQGVITYNFVLQ
jgi:TonB family protein